MTMRKFLAVLLCVCAMLSLMAVAAAAEGEVTEPVKSIGDQIIEAWQSFMFWFKPLYEGVFPLFSRGLAVLVEWLLRIVGIGTWVLPWAA